MNLAGQPNRPKRPGNSYPRAGSRHRCLGCIIGLVLLLLAAGLPVGPGSALAAPGLQIEDDPTQPWNIAADKITRDQKTGSLVASGNVVITKQGKRLSADRIVFNQSTGHLSAEGHVMLMTGKDVLTGNRVEMNLNTRKGVIDQGTLFIDSNHFYIQGDRIRKTGEESYTVEKPAITSCDGEKPDWKITGKKLDVTVEGYGYVSGATLWARSLPVFYSPFLAFPAKIKRQTGLLIPQAGNSERKGFEYIQPLFWAINEQSDATFYAHHMQDRGEKLGMEYRYVLDPDSKGTAMADGFSDRRIDDGTAENLQWGYPDDGLTRTNTDRYWFRMKHDQLLKYGISTKIDLDVVSDQDYLKEFQDGYTGFDQTENYYTQNFGRGLDRVDETVRANQISFNKTGNAYSLTADILWNDDVVVRQSGDPDDTLHTLPRITYTASKQALPDTPVFFDATGDYVHFYRETGARGNRVQMYPRAYYPLTWGNYLSLEPSAGVLGTAWYMDSTDSTTLDDRAYYRGIYDAKLDLSSEIFRVFSTKGDNKIRHTAIPRVVYEYVPRQDQSDLPYFEASDRIAAKNLITYSITNRLTSRTAAQKGPLPPSGPVNRAIDKRRPGRPDTTPTAVYDYDQFCRFEIGQSYDLNRAGYGEPEPFYPIYGDLELRPGRHMSIRADAEWSIYEDHFTSHNIGMGLNNDRRDRLYTEYRFERYESESIYVDLKVSLTARVEAYTLYERNIREKTDIETGLGMIYRSQCWFLDFGYRSTANDTRYTFLINLTGLGGLGSDF